MKSTCAVALLLLAVFTECLGAQSERSRQRSGPIRSVPVAADIKRDTDFDCPEEFGYYPHPTDCTLYYVCVFGGALLESCTGGLMYSHELQTCDWPRNVGCDGTSAAGGEELARISERDQERNNYERNHNRHVERNRERNQERNLERNLERNQEINLERNPPPPPPPRRNPPPPPPPPPRAQPNPVITSRGQPKFNREEYEKQQQLYAEVDDLPPVEEIETDRQQRVYRGQPSTIGQVQKDRDGYGSQVVNSRTLNANIIPASIPQTSGKIGSFSFGTQVDERRTATATQSPQTYSKDTHDNVTDSPLDRQIDIATNEIDVNGMTDKILVRSKRETNQTIALQEMNSSIVKNASQRIDGEFEIFEMEPEDHDDEEDDVSDEESSLDDVERGKRQVRYYLHKGYKNPGKAWSSSKPIRFVDFQQFNYNPISQNTKHQQTYNGLSNNQFIEASRKPYTNDNNLYSTANPFSSFQAQQNDNKQLNSFKPSLPDPFQRVPHAPMNVATQIITKSPPISALTNNENPFSALAGGFYNNIPSQNVGSNQQIHNINNQYSAQSISTVNRPVNQPENQISIDSSLLATTVVTGKPVPNPSSPRPRPRHKVQSKPNDNSQSQKGQVYQNQNIYDQSHSNNKPEAPEEIYDEEEEDDENEDEESSEEAENDGFKHDFPDPPYEFTHPSNRYASIENPFANPNFDFDAFLAKLRGDETISVSSPKPYNQNTAVKIINSPVESSSSPTNTGLRSSTLNYKGMSTPRPFAVPIGHDGISESTGPDQNFVSTTEREQTEKLKNLIQQSIAQHQQEYRQKQQQQQSQNENIRQQQQKSHNEKLRQQQQQFRNEKIRDQQQQQQSLNDNFSLHQQQSYDDMIRQHQKIHNENVRHQQQQQSYNENVRHTQNQQQSSKENGYSRPQKNAGIPLDAVRPKLKPPNFKDDRQLPITYNFERPVSSTPNPQYEKPKTETSQIFTVTQKPYVYITGTGAPIILSTPKQNFVIKPNKVISLQPQIFATGKPYIISTIKSQNAYAIFKQSTAKPMTTLANEQLSALQHYWNNPTTETYLQSTAKPVNIPKLESLFAQAIRSSTQSPLKQRDQATTTTAKPSQKRRPIPKPSPEMNDYYYEDDEQYYYEPPIKSKYMPSTEVKPKRPPMAQNFHEYEDYEDSEESSVNNKPLRTPYRKPMKYNSYKPESATKNHNDVSVVTKSPLKDSNKYINGKIPVLVDYGTPAPNVLMRPEISNYQIMHHTSRNRTIHMRKPTSSENGPFTLRPPKYLNKTTLRPYTVRHRLAQPTTVKDLTQTTQSDVNKQTRGRMRHHNIVAQMKFTTPRDSQKQETRFTKTKHDDKTNSLEPTESVTPSSYASPRPKMLYNGTQAYSPDQYDPYYAVYDEDGELYKDTDYVQQYNTASLRPAVQQTYRGTPPPAPSRRPVETYTPRPSQDDYDDALIHGQINNQNQYQTPIRHSTRGEGNELGYDNNPSSVKTTLYEATSISTTPSTTSTSTTQRPTIAPFTEAMNPSRYTPRSSTDDPIRDPESSSENPSNGSTSPIPSSPSPMINFSSLAKPFEKTDNSYRLQDTLTSTERSLNYRLPSLPTNRNVNKKPLDVVQPDPESDNKKVVSLTTGFSIRRNPSNSNNPYTLTVLTRPFDHFNKSYSAYAPGYRAAQESYNQYFKDTNDAREISIESQEDTFINSQERPVDASMRRKDASSEIVSDEDGAVVRIRPSQTDTVLKPKIKLASTPTTGTTKYYLKLIKRPAGFATKNDEKEDSTENIIKTDTLIETGLKNARANGYLNLNNTNSTEAPKWDQSNDLNEQLNKPTLLPYRMLDNFRKPYIKKEKFIHDYSTSSAATTRFTTAVPKESVRQYVRTEGKTTSKPAYYSYRVVDEEIPDHTTEVFSGTVKNIIKAFFDNFSVTPKIQPSEENSNTTPKITTSLQPVEKVVNIGFQKKPYKYVDEKPLRNNVQRLPIITEPSVNRFVSPSVETIRFTGRNPESSKDFVSTTASMISDSSTPQSTTSTIRVIPKHNEYAAININSKFSFLVQNKPEEKSLNSDTLIENSRKFHKIISDELEPSNYQDKLTYNHVDNEVTKLTNTEPTKTVTELDWNLPTNKVLNEIATTTSTTKSTTVRTEPTTPTTKSISFPTRPSRVNPAIKLAATNPGGGRRSYQSSSKCSSDNSLQANPKCNEIKYQRPSGSTRQRGSAHYSTLGGSEAPQQQSVNRGTPPTRSRPTLKPSTAVVTNPHPVVDIYTHPPGRPAPVYPQPTPDKTAAKCRKDVCLLPDCSCGGKDIPGDIPVETVPQIVLLTFDDSVNDLNKGLYADLFEKGRVNPNGCPISATFYVSHEWTDYSQVQNLYSAGHEMASHTISHSFGEQFSQKKWNREVSGQREILAAYGGVKLEDVRGMRAPFLSVGGNKMFKMLYDSNFTYDSSMPVYENRPPSWPYTLDYKLFHDCMIPPCPTKSYPGVWEVPMVMWQDLNGGRCSMGDACANPPESEGVYKMLLKNFDRHYTTNRAPFGLFYHAAWFTQPHHKEGFIMFLDFINQMQDVWIVTNWQALQWVRDPTPISRINNFQPFQCNYQDRPKKCNNPKVCNLWHKSGVRYMRTCQPCPEVYPWTGKTGIKSSRIDNDIED